VDRVGVEPHDLSQLSLRTDLYYLKEEQRLLKENLTVQIPPGPLFFSLLALRSSVPSSEVFKEEKGSGVKTR
jgi:hypothetical protein